jgi:hypothetical protein
VFTDALKTDKLCVSASRNPLELLFRFTGEHNCEQKDVLQEHSTHLAEKLNSVPNKQQTLAT